MWIIDGRGVVRSVWARELPRLLGASFGGEQLANYAVENLGFIETKILPRGTLIRLRPQYVSRKSLAGLCYWLYERGDRPCTVSWLAGTWRHVIQHGFCPTMRLIEALCEASVVTDGETPVGVKKRRLANATAAFRVDWEVVGRLVAMAAESGWAREELSLRFGGRWTISAFDTGNGQVTVRSMGEGYPLYDCAWTCQPLGKSFAEFPDPAYGRFVTESHREAIRLARPIHDEVDARINWPRFGLLRTRYERVIAPFSSGAETLLLSAAKVDPGIDLGGVVRQKPLDVGEQLSARHP
jgi:hypothetical protein